MNRKPRSDARLLNLPHAQQSQLADWLLQGMAYTQAQARLAKDFHVQVSCMALSRFYKAVCLPLLRQRRHTLGQATQKLATEITQTPFPFLTVALDALQQKICELALGPTAPLKPAELSSLFRSLLKVKDQQLNEQRLDLQRQKLASPEASQRPETIAAVATRPLDPNREVSEEERLA